jgi:hypothetical protein
VWVVDVRCAGHAEVVGIAEAALGDAEFARELGYFFVVGGSVRRTQGSLVRDLPIRR